MNLTSSQKLLLLGLFVSKRTILKMVPIEDFQFDPKYQRGEILSTVEQVSEDYHEQALGIFHAGQRTKTKVLYSIDGKSRLEGLRLRKAMGLECPTHVLTLIFLDTTRKEEAALFVWLNNQRPLIPSAKMKAEIVGGQGNGSQVEKCLRSEGFTVNFIAAGRPTVHNTTLNGIYAATVIKNKSEELRLALQLIKLVGATRKKGTKTEIAKSVPLPLRNGELICGLETFFYRCKVDVKKVARDIRRCEVDLPEMWKYARKYNPSVSRWSTFAARLRVQLGYDYSYLKAA